MQQICSSLAIKRRGKECSKWSPFNCVSFFTVSSMLLCSTVSREKLCLHHPMLTFWIADCKGSIAPIVGEQLLAPVSLWFNVDVSLLWHVFSVQQPYRKGTGGLIFCKTTIQNMVTTEIYRLPKSFNIMINGHIHTCDCN